jgi:hypothetical protein
VADAPGGIEGPPYISAQHDRQRLAGVLAPPVADADDGGEHAGGTDGEQHTGQCI